MRLLEDEQSFLDKPLLEFTHPNPKTIAPEELAAKALHEMETHSITCLVVVDQESGPTTPCDWIEFGRTKIDLDNADVASCRLINSRIVELITPQGWRYEDSLSQNLSIEHTDQTRKYLQFLRQEDGQEIYLNKMTGEEVAIDLP